VSAAVATYSAKHEERRGALRNLLGAPRA